MSDFGLQGMSVMVTGASGLMGFPIAKALAKSNKVYGVARYSSEKERQALEAAGVETIAFDVGSSDLSALPEKVDVIFHLGAITGLTAGLPENRLRAFEVNTYSAGRLMSRYRNQKGGLKAFVYPGSGSAYAYQGERPLREDDVFGLHTGLENYAATKIGGESLVQFLSSEWKIPSVIIRIFSLYSPRGGAITSRVDLVAAGRPIALYPGVPNRYCPMYEDDFVEKAIRAVTLAKCPAEVVNFAGTETVTIEEYCAVAGRLLRKTPTFQSTSHLYPIWPDMTKMEKLLGPTRVGIEEGVRRVIAADPSERLLHWATVMPFAPVED